MKTVVILREKSITSYIAHKWWDQTCHLPAFIINMPLHRVCAHWNLTMGIALLHEQEQQEQHSEPVWLSGMPSLVD